MIKTISISSFKSLQSVDVELGQVNVFIGANGSGKSNFLEAIGVLSAAANGRIDDGALMARGVRPGLPALYKSAFKKTGQGQKIATTIEIAATSLSEATYRVNLHNPITDPLPAWRYQTESWTDEQGISIVGRSNHSKEKFNPEAGLAALKMVEMPEMNPARDLLERLQRFRIYSPNTQTLRGIAPENQPQRPVGLSGGGLPAAVNGLRKLAREDNFVKEAFDDVLELIDWASQIDAVSSNSIALSPSAATSKEVVRFEDRFMVKERNFLSGADASEGALYVLYTMALALDPEAPRFLSIDNADHGLNPRLAKRLMELITSWTLNTQGEKQILLTTHNPLVLDGLPLTDDRVRLFTVSRLQSGQTDIQRVVIDDNMKNALKNDYALSRLWVMGHIGGIPNV